MTNGIFIALYQASRFDDERILLSRSNEYDDRHFRKAAGITAPADFALVNISLCRAEFLEVIMLEPRRRKLKFYIIEVMTAIYRRHHAVSILTVLRRLRWPMVWRRQLF